MDAEDRESGEAATSSEEPQDRRRGGADVGSTPFRLEPHSFGSGQLLRVEPFGYARYENLKSDPLAQLRYAADRFVRLQHETSIIRKTGSRQDEFSSKIESAREHQNEAYTQLRALQELLSYLGPIPESALRRGGQAVAEGEGGRGGDGGDGGGSGTTRSGAGTDGEGGLRHPADAAGGNNATVGGDAVAASAVNRGGTVISALQSFREVPLEEKTKDLMIAMQARREALEPWLKRSREFRTSLCEAIDEQVEYLKIVEQLRRVWRISRVAYEPHVYTDPGEERRQTGIHTDSLTSRQPHRKTERLVKEHADRRGVRQSVGMPPWLDAS
eukprot:GHVU01068058.1.p1 GENE.GHVU01068058.1~~GHVU01068058.1.p1  ORF type:complete len:329 (-),score=39.80 GHVU01068058.1:506-1492(-)